MIFSEQTYLERDRERDIERKKGIGRVREGERER